MPATIEDAKKLLARLCANQAGCDAEIMQGVDGERLHALDVLSWVERFNPDASLALRLAALFHDIDRVANPQMVGGFKGDRDSRAYLLYKKRHARRSAAIIVPQLRRYGFNSKTISRMEFLIRHHDGSDSEVDRCVDTELDCLVAADAFAFFTSNAPKLFAAEGANRLRDKIRFIIKKLQEGARVALWENRLENALFERLKNEVIREFYLRHGRRERAYRYCPSCRKALRRKPIEGQALLACGACGFVFWNPPHPVTSVIIEREGKVLFIRRAFMPLHGYWCLPGGYIQYSETPEAAAVREVKEETGLEVVLRRLIGVYQIDNDPRGVNLDIIWAGSAIGGNVLTNEESSEFGFFSCTDLPERVAYKHREAVHDWQKECQGAVSG